MFEKQDEKANILIIDDEPEITGLLFNLLREDYECSRAGSAEDGLALLYAKEFDLVLTDIQMGGMSGLEFVSKLIDHAPDTVVIMISGLHTIETAITAMRVGAFDYITKPFDLLHVEAAVRRALDHRRLRQAKRHYENYLEELVRQRTQEVKQALASLKATYRSTLRALTTALDTRDSETHGHSERVVRFSLRLGRELGLDSAEMTALEYGSLLHDIGKVGVPDAILRKPAGLTEDEWSQMRLHPLHGKQILKGVEFLEGASLVVEQHHEKWDGSGYPQGLAGEQIDLKARIFAVADTFDAIMSNRVYRKGNTYEEAVAELRRCAGTQFDPAVVAAFECVSAEEWDEVRHSHTLSRVQRVKEDQAPLYKALMQDNAMAISFGRANSGGLRAA
jgi:cyclic di-GMP phosphodiesterase